MCFERALPEPCRRDIPASSSTRAKRAQIEGWAVQLPGQMVCPDRRDVKTSTSARLFSGRSLFVVVGP